MIKVIGDWYVTTQGDPTNYVVRKGSGEHLVKKDGSNGGYKDRPLAYCMSLESALRFIRRETINERLDKPEMSLKQAIDTIAEVIRQFEFAITGKKS